MASLPSVVSPAPRSGISDKKWRSILNDITVKAFRAYSQSTVVRNKWLTAESLLKLMKQRYPFDDIGGLTEMQLNKALEGHYAHLESANIELNDTGVFRVTHSITDPYSDESKSIKMRCYYITEPGIMMPELPGNNDKEGWRRLYIEARERQTIAVHGPIRRLHKSQKSFTKALKLIKRSIILPKESSRLFLFKKKVMLLSFGHMPNVLTRITAMRVRGLHNGQYSLLVK